VVIASRDPHGAAKARDCGASGFVRLPCVADDLRTALDGAAAGGWSRTEPVDTPPPPPPAPRPGPEGEPSFAEARSKGDRLTILVVDDSAVVHGFVGGVLEEAGYAVLRADDGVEGLEAARVHRPDLIISDIDMPRMDGFEMCRRVKEDPVARSIPILILSARGAGMDIDRGFEVGANDYLTKPVSEAELLSHLELVLGVGASRGESVLVVEDVDVQRSAVVQALARQGYDVLEARDGEEGLRLAVQEPPDLVITDLVMPGLDGVEMTRRIRESEGLEDVPVVILTAADSETSRLRSRQAGVSAYLTKPFVPDKVVVIAEKLIGERRLIREREQLAEHARQLQEANERLEVARADAEAAREEADAANRAKSTFLASMSHEIRTPMNAILGFSQLLDRDPDLASGHRNQVGTILRSGEHLLGLINDILDMSKIEAGSMTLVEGPGDVRSMLDDIALMFRVRTDGKGIGFELEVEEGFPRHVTTDEGKLRQILINLLGNAVKFTDQGGITLRAHHSDGPEGPRLHFDVVDTGPGIPGDDLERIFSAFEQTEAGKKVTGTGLGLPISREFARLMGGDIVAESDGPGATFRLHVGVEILEDADAPEAEEKLRVRGLEEGQDPPRLLLVDAQPDNLEFARILLEDVGFEVRCESDGAEAVAAFESWDPDLVLMDDRLPGLSGSEASARMRELGAAPIVAVTASAFEEDRKAILDTWADGFVRKPYTDDVLLEEIADRLGVRYAYEEATEEGDALDPGSIEALPDDVVEPLRAAMAKLDLDALVAALDAVAEHDQGVADRLRELADAFDFEGLSTLLEG
jgi:CheY-like chemotaxis protein